MPISGTPKFTSLSIAEVAVEFRSDSAIMLSCKAAFLDTERHAAYGWTRGEGSIWSPETMALLNQLRESMEQDMARLHFVDQPVRNGVAVGQPTQVLGIGEHIGQDADQV